MIQVIDSIPWVRCASGNVFSSNMILIQNFSFPSWDFHFSTDITLLLLNILLNNSNKRKRYTSDKMRKDCCFDSAVQEVLCITWEVSDREIAWVVPKPLTSGYVIVPDFFSQFLVLFFTSVYFFHSSFFTRIFFNFGHQVASLVLVTRKLCTLPHIFLQFWHRQKADNNW